MKRVFLLFCFVLGVWCGVGGGGGGVAAAAESDPGCTQFMADPVWGNIARVYNAWRDPQEALDVLRAGLPHLQRRFGDSPCMARYWNAVSGAHRKHLTIHQKSDYRRCLYHVAAFQHAERRVYEADPGYPPRDDDFVRLMAAALSRIWWLSGKSGHDNAVRYGLEATRVQARQIFGKGCANRAAVRHVTGVPVAGEGHVEAVEVVYGGGRPSPVYYALNGNRSMTLERDFYCYIDSGKVVREEDGVGHVGLRRVQPPGAYENPLIFKDILVSHVSFRDMYLVHGSILWDGACTVYGLHHSPHLLSTKTLDVRVSGAYPKPDLELEEAVALVTAPTSMYNFYHFMIEVLPTLPAQQALLKARPKAKVLVVHVERLWFVKPMVESICRATGIADDRIVYVTPDMVMRARRMYALVHHEDPRGEQARFPEINSMYYPPVDMVSNLARGLRSRLPWDQRRLIVYLQRAPRKDNTGSRAVNNEELFLDPLRKLFSPGTVVVHGYSNRSSLAMATQVGLFHQARIIFGPHGAGLSNQMMAGCGTKVVEFPVVPLVHNHFSHLAAALGLEYYTVPQLNSTYYLQYTATPESADKVVELIMHLYKQKPTYCQ